MEIFRFTSLPTPFSMRRNWRVLMRATTSNWRRNIEACSMEQSRRWVAWTGGRWQNRGAPSRGILLGAAADPTSVGEFGSATASVRIGAATQKRHIGNDAPQLAETEPDRVVTLRSVAYVVLLLKVASDCALGIPGSSVDTPSAPADGCVPIGAVDRENRA